MSFDAKLLIEKRISSILATTVLPCPPGTYPGVIQVPFAKQFKRKDGTDGYAVFIPVEIDSESAKVATGRQEIICRMFVEVTLTPEGEIESGDGVNIDLGRVMEALDLNDGKHSIADLEARNCYVTITNRTDPNDPNKVFDQVSSIKAYN